jgi:hypothetical protein
VFGGRRGIHCIKSTGFVLSKKDRHSQATWNGCPDFIWAIESNDGEAESEKCLEVLLWVREMFIGASGGQGQKETLPG